MHGFFDALISGRSQHAANSLRKNHTYHAMKQKKGIQKNNHESSSHSSSISTSVMEDIISRLKQRRIRTSTKNNYYGVWKTFNEFFIRLDRKPNNWEDRIVLFVGYLVDKKRKSTTIRSYVSAIKSVLREDGVTVSENKYLINSLTRACRLVNDKVRIRLPIQSGVLSILLLQLPILFEQQQYLCIMYHTIMTTAYFGLFRVGELTKGDHPVKVTDVLVADNKNNILILLRTSKTHGEDSYPQTIKIIGNKWHLDGKITSDKTRCPLYCPFSALNEYIKIRPMYQDKSEQFFIFRDFSPVQASQFRTVLKTLLKLANFNHELYDTHSICTVHSVDPLNFGCIVETISKLGRWKSSAIYTYLKT